MNNLTQDANNSRLMFMTSLRYGRLKDARMFLEFYRQSVEKMQAEIKEFVAQIEDAQEGKNE